MGLIRQLMRNDLDDLNFGQLIGERREAEGRMDEIGEEINWLEERLATRRNCLSELVGYIGDVRRKLNAKNTRT